jgi:hypothetical protein
MKSRSTGLLASQFDKVGFYKIENEEYNYTPLLMESNIMSMSYHNSGHVLVSTRPTQKNPKVRHLVYEFTSHNVNANEASASASTLSLLQTYYGSNVQKMLARSKLFFCDSRLFGLSPCETTKTGISSFYPINLVGQNLRTFFWSTQFSFDLGRGLWRD